MNDIIKDIQRKLNDGAYTTEEHVRLSLVSRILQALGWNIWDPSEVNTEFIAVPQEDQTRVDVALFINTFSPIIFIEVKAVGKLAGNLRNIELQLRDYNRNNTALFSIMTDGRHWRFYYSQTGGEFSQKCFKEIDLVKDSIDDIETFLNAFLSKSEVISGNAKRDAESYLKLSRKQRAMEDALPKARRLVLEPPFPSLPQALVELTSKAGYPVTTEEASKFIKESVTESRERLDTSNIVDTELSRTTDSTQRQSVRHGGEPDYVVSYRSQLNNPSSLASKMRKYINDRGSLTWAELKKACVEKFGCISEISGSIGASLRVLELDGWVRIEGKGNSKRISSGRRL